MSPLFMAECRREAALKQLNKQKYADKRRVLKAATAHDSNNAAAPSVCNKSLHEL